MITISSKIKIELECNYIREKNWFLRIVGMDTQSLQV